LSHPLGYPDPPNAFQLYKSAKKFLILSLSDYCLKYMKAGITSSNITGLLFRTDCELRHHEELKDIFMEYLLANYDKVKTTEGWRKVVFEDEEVDSSVRTFHKELLFEIMERLVYTPMAITSEA
jgi:hypothetical protein